MKRFVEVEVKWDEENQTWYEYDGDGGYYTYGKTLTLHDLVSQVPDIREKMKQRLHIVTTPETTRDIRDNLIADSILQLFKEV
jgi:hypothetical protein